MCQCLCRARWKTIDKTVLCVLFWIRFDVVSYCSLIHFFPLMTYDMLSGVIELVTINYTDANGSNSLNSVLISGVWSLVHSTHNLLRVEIC